MRCSEILRSIPAGLVAGIVAATIPCFASGQGLQFGIGGAATETAEEAPEPAADAAAAMVADNTLAGWRLGTPFVEYYDQDGSIRGRSNNALYDGTWHIDDGQICLDYNFGNVTDFDRCGTLVQQGDNQLILQDESGSLIQDFELTPGNPEQL